MTFVSCEKPPKGKRAIDLDARVGTNLWHYAEVYNDCIRYWGGLRDRFQPTADPRPGSYMLAHQILETAIETNSTLKAISSLEPSSKNLETVLGTQRHLLGFTALTLYMQTLPPELVETVTLAKDIPSVQTEVVEMRYPNFRIHLLSDPTPEATLNNWYRSDDPELPLYLRTNYPARMSPPTRHQVESGGGVHPDLVTYTPYLIDAAHLARPA